jgi:tetratricopeptide (TPR) repeat protein
MNCYLFSGKLILKARRFLKTLIERSALRVGVLLILTMLPAWTQLAQAVDEAPASDPGFEQELQGAEAYFHFAMAKLAQRQQRYDAAVAFLRQAAEADPDSASIQSELASTFMVIRDYPAAEQAAQRALELEPENASAHTVLAHLYYSRARRGIEPEVNRQRAMEQLQASLSGDEDDDPDVLLTLGRFYFEEGDYVRAAETLQRYLDSQPGSPTNPLFLLARAQIQLEDYDGAEKSLELVLASVPDSLQALETLINIKRLRGDHAGSLPLLEKVLSIQGGDASLYKKMGEASFHMEDFAGAREMFEMALSEEPDSPYSLYYLALSQESLGLVPEALETLEKMRLNDPDNSEVVFRMAQLRDRQGDNKEAIALYRQLIKLLEAVEETDESRRQDVSTFCARVAILQMEDEAYVDAARELDDCQDRIGHPAPGLELLRARALVFARRDEKALAAVKRIAKLFPDDPRFPILEAEILLHAGQEEEGARQLQEWLETATAEAPEGHAERLRGLVADAWFNAGAQAERRGNLERAERYLLKAIEVEPDHTAALNYLGYTWADAGRRLDDALELLLRVVALDPDNGAYQDSLGWVYFRMGRLDEARTHLLKAAESEMGDPTIHEHLGDLENEAGDFDRAGAYWRRALEIGADDPQAVQDKIEEMEQRTAAP